VYRKGNVQVVKVQELDYPLLGLYQGNGSNTSQIPAGDKILTGKKNKETKSDKQKNEKTNKQKKGGTQLQWRYSHSRT